MNKYRESYKLSESEIEYRDRLVDELKHRTGAATVHIAAYTIRQDIEPKTIHDRQIFLELRVGNHVVSMTFSDTQVGFAPNALHYGMRELGNRMIDTLIKAGAQTL